MDNEQEQDQYQESELLSKKRSYGKWSWKKWLLIYVIVGVAIYGIIYLMAAYANSSDDNSNNGTGNGVYRY